MEYFLDIHCHILPGVDDGAKDEEMTLEMLRMAYEEGIRVIVATPHHHPMRGMATKAELSRQFKVTRELAKQIDDSLHVVPGMEIYFTEDIICELDEKKLKTIGKSRYLLVEFSTGADYFYIRRSLQEIQMKGYSPILAHVERYKCMTDNLENVRELVDLGIVIQVNAGSIIGESGRNIKKFILNLMEERLVHLVGTDAHNVKSRAPKMQKSARKIEKLFGREYMREIFYLNGMCILQDKNL